MMRKVVALFTLLLSMSLGLGACGSSDGSVAVQATTPAAKKQVTPAPVKKSPLAQEKVKPSPSHSSKGQDWKSSTERKEFYSLYTHGSKLVKKALEQERFDRTVYQEFSGGKELSFNSPNAMGPKMDTSQSSLWVALDDTGTILRHAIAAPGGVEVMVMSRQVDGSIDPYTIITYIADSPDGLKTDDTPSWYGCWADPEVCKAQSVGPSRGATANAAELESQEKEAWRLYNSAMSQVFGSDWRQQS